ncbi:HK97 family phage prohead protease [Terrisporobacter hibernicus]|uniref:HK97 family phage prohead protease n=1 Tax=Terrisporobacter hibernicus TaxID=2813371 RepID=A0AAX2ZF49_9FIRM|nr:HK97 family phage prohead protease [Terrisporobacter hibernicus]UEL47350.1 HK97 family phage prohead protease [Terrisporobacter hibernicus]
MMNKQMNELSVVRSFNVSDFRATDNEKYNVEGHAAVFNQTTTIGNWFYEVIERGAFDECDFDDVLFFVNHNQNKIPLARSRRNNGNSTMKLEVNETGLYIRADLDIENNSESRTLHSSISRGDIDGMSFSFRIKEQTWENLDSDMPTRKITKIAKVYEVSAVNQPAYSNTDINARDKVALENAKIALENARSKTNELDNSKALEIERLRTKILMNV